MTAIGQAPAIRVSGLRKSYGDLLVVDGIDLDIAPGTVFALLGPNGAGKTTTVNILTTLLAPDAGEVAVGGHDLRTDPAGIRSAIGVTGQFSAVDDLLTGFENLRLMADLNHLGREEGRRRTADLLERCCSRSWPVTNPPRTRAATRLAVRCCLPTSSWAMAMRC